MEPTSYARRHPIAFALGATVGWFVLLIVFTGLASTALGKRFDDPVVAAAGRVAVAACLVWWLSRLGWLRSAGVARIGRGRVWLLAVASLMYFAAASLYAFYGHPALAFSALGLPAARAIVLAALAAGVCEELLFRGAVLHALARTWGRSLRGLGASAAFTSLLFAILHLTQLFGGLSSASAPILVAQTALVAFWWGALVLAGGSIWPAVMLHGVGNAVVAVQALSVPAIEPGVEAYTKVLLFSIPLGIAGLVLIARTSRADAPRRGAGFAATI
jgi:membrane protease YdiL (CAAX protease family)